MAASGIVANSENFITEHPYASVGIVLGTVLIIWWIASPSSTATPVASTDDTAVEAAAAVAAQNAQTQSQLGLATISANASTAQAQLAADSLNQQTAAAQAIALNGQNTALQTAVANATALTGVAQYQSQADIAASNNAAYISQSSDATALAMNANNTVGSEFASLASLLGQFGTTMDTNSGTANAVAGAATSINANNDTLAGQLYQTFATLQNQQPGDYIPNASAFFGPSNEGSGQSSPVSVSSGSAGLNGIDLNALTGATTTTALTGAQFTTLFQGLQPLVGASVTQATTADYHAAS